MMGESSGMPIQQQKHLLYFKSENDERGTVLPL